MSCKVHAIELAFLNQRRGHTSFDSPLSSVQLSFHLVDHLGTWHHKVCIIHGFTTALQASLHPSYVSENAQGKESKDRQALAVTTHHDTTHRRGDRPAASQQLVRLMPLAPGPGDLTAAVLVSYPWSLNLRCPVTDRSEANSSCCRLPSVSASASASQPPIEMCFA